jgi:hypothetical protein
MKYGQRLRLLNAKGHETTSNFKTAKFHDVQAISSSELFALGMQVYLLARKQIAKTDEMYDDDAPLFLTFTGHKEYRIGSKVELNNNNNNNNN